MSRKKYSLIGEIADFDYHGFWGDWCSPKSLKSFLDTLAPGEEAEIEINSPGGSVVQGIEMANAIKNSKAVLVAHVTGIAASMASVIACACHRIEMEEASFMMIHDPWSYAEGNAEELRKQASVLDQMKAVIMSFYRGKFKGLTEDQISALMSDETWYTGAECKENGLECTVIASDIRAAASIVGHKFAKMPEAAAKFLTSKELTDEGKAEIEAAKAKAKAEAQGEDKPSESSTGNNSAAENAAAANAAASGTEPSEGGDWEARYKGASKKINELQARISEFEKNAVDAEAHGAVVAERDGLKAQVAALEETGAKAAKSLKDFEDQVKASGFENLAALVGAVSELKASLEQRDGELAECRQQLDHMKETRDLLTGGVLTPAEQLPTMQDGLAKCRTPKEKSAFLASGKYRKNK
jgi:ATP-dependent Clp protease protease subunit